MRSYSCMFLLFGCFASSGQSDAPVDQTTVAPSEARTAGSPVTNPVSSKLSSASIAELREAALYGESLEVQGQAVLTLVRATDAAATEALLDIEAQGRAAPLVRTWAAAGLVQRAKSLDELVEIADLLKRHPSLDRPVRIAAERLAAGGVDVETMLLFSSRAPGLSKVFATQLVAAPVEEMGRLMLTHSEDSVRRLAAGFLASRDDDADGILKMYDYKSSGAEVIWKGGALYVPSLGWSRAQAKQLMGDLIAWHLHCDRHGLTQEKQQVFNNLRSVGIWRQAGSRGWPKNDTLVLLRQYAELMGVQVVAGLLKKQGVRHDPRYAAALEGK